MEFFMEEGEGGGRFPFGFSPNYNNNNFHRAAGPPLTAIDKFLNSQAQKFIYINHDDEIAKKLNKIETLIPDHVNFDQHGVGGGLISSYSSSCSEIHGRLPWPLIQDKSFWVPETNLFGNNYVAADDHVINYLKRPKVYHGKTENFGSSMALIKGQWTDEEDSVGKVHRIAERRDKKWNVHEIAELIEFKKLSKLVKEYGVKKWAQIAEKMVGRAGKQCRERWHNHLRPDIKKDNWTKEEELMLIEGHQQIGNKWAEIAKRIPGRTENSIKNHWNATKRRQNSRRKTKTPQSNDPQKQHPTMLQDYIWSICPTKNDTPSSCISASASVDSDSNMTSYYNTLTSENVFSDISTAGYGDTAYEAIYTTHFQPNMKTCVVDCSTYKVASQKLPTTSLPTWTDPTVYPDLSGTSEDSTSYLAQTFDEEMKFMQNLFGNNSTESSHHDTNKNPSAKSSLGFSSPTRQIDFDFAFFSSSSSSSEANFQLNSCNTEDKKCYLSQLFEGSNSGVATYSAETFANDNSVPSMETVNSSYERKDIDLIEMISGSQFSHTSSSNGYML